MSNLHEIKVNKLPAITQSQLINRINILHFQDDVLLVSLKHLTYGYDVLLKATPMPSVNEKVNAVWVKGAIFPPDLNSYRLDKIIIPGTYRTIEFFPDNIKLNKDAIKFNLPTGASELCARTTIRHLCRNQGLKVSLIQHSAAFYGELLDFSPQALRIQIQLRPSDPQNFFWLNPDLPSTLVISKDDTPIYSGQVKIRDRVEEDGDVRICVVEPLEDSTPRFKPKKHRARRQEFTPSPDLVFTHPLTGRKCTIKVGLISSLGFSVLESEKNSSLLPGLLLPEVELSFANSLCLKFTAQVVNRGPSIDGFIKYGVALLDIELQDHLKLISLIQQAQDPHSYVSNQVDPEALFEFFFETGFLYPSKYSEVSANREEFKDGYFKLYKSGSELTRHFVYQEEGQILGHFSTIRTHRSTWMNQHHAALGSNRAGLKVVRAISEFINDSFFLNPANMKYITGFYRPENKFPAKFFGGFVKATNDKTITSIDEFAFIKQADLVGDDWNDKPGDWEIARANDNDIVAFRGFYKQSDGGLMADAFDIDVGAYDDGTLTEVYSKAGLKRHRHFYAIRQDETLKALVEVQDSALGLNMSELTNAMIVYVLDQEEFEERLFRMVVLVLSTKHKKQQHPLMIYPRSYADKYDIKTDKVYNLWTLDLKNCDPVYMDWLYRYCKKL